jgi:hypothetical protein
MLAVYGLCDFLINFMVSEQAPKTDTKRDDKPVMLEIVRKFILKLVPPNRRPTGAIAQRVTSLDHEFSNDTVENDALKETTPSVANKVLDCLGRLLREQAHVDVSHGRMQRSCVR